MTHMIQALQRINNQLPELLSEEFVGGLAREVGWQWRKRVLSPVVMIHLLILQILHRNTAYSHLPRASKLPFTAAAFCQAKRRLPQALLARLIESVWLRCSKADDSTLFHGHRTVYTDGSAASMPDTQLLQDRYGMPSGMKEGCGFPVLKLLMLFDVATGLIRQVLIHAYRRHELPLVQQLHGLLQRGDLLIGDRGFCSFVHLASLTKAGMHGLFRLHQRVAASFDPKGANLKGMRKRRVKILGPDDQLVIYGKPKLRPKWISPREYDALPMKLVVRELRYWTGRAGFRCQVVVLVTTLLDAEKYPAIELAELYGRRWQVEINFRHLKTTLKMEVLHGKSPKMVETEILAYVLVYNLVQLVIHAAARRQGVPPDRISFIDTVRWIIEAAPGETLTQLIVNPKRPGRFGPRVRKRRRNGYSFMTRPRSELSAMIARGGDIKCR
ncbi:MAG: IS4 family transposase, partial [Phycisphaerae bacterium]